MISTVAANLIDMLWEQNKLEEAEATLYQAREVPTPAFPPPPRPLFKKGKKNSNVLWIYIEYSLFLLNTLY